jgi:hypothetical protein
MQGTAFGTPLCHASHRGFWPEFAEDRSRVAAEGIVIFHESATNYDVVVTQGQPFIFKIIVSEVVQKTNRSKRSFDAGIRGLRIIGEPHVTVFFPFRWRYARASNIGGFFNS